MRIGLFVLMVWAAMGKTLAQEPADSLGELPAISSGVDSAYTETGYRLFLPAGKLETSSVYGPYSGERVASDSLFGAAKPVQYIPEQRRVVQRTDWKFYLFCGIIFFLALLRQIFPRYFTDLFTIFFHTSVRQKQLRDQLGQSLLPSLLFSLFFYIMGGIFLHLTEGYLGMDGYFQVSVSMLLWFSVLASLYLTKYLLIEFLGWVFQAGEASHHYIFVVFTVNKVIGLFLLPFVVLMAYTEGATQELILQLALTGLGILVLARLVRGYQAVKSLLQIHLLHYLIFVAAFEIIPVLLVCKLLVQFIRE